MDICRSLCILAWSPLCGRPPAQVLLSGLRLVVPLTGRMVVDAAHQAYNTMSSTPPKKSEERSKKKSSQMNGFHVRPAPGPGRSLSSAPTAQRRLSGSAMYSCGWMRRSESSCTLNNSSGGGARGRMRPAGSLPSISKAAADNRTVKRTSCLLVALRPTNVEQERDKFFLSDYSYNPQFQYQEPMSAGVVEKYSQASNQFLAQALRILNAVLKKYGSYESFESLTGGGLLSKCQIWACCRRYMQKESCSGEAASVRTRSTWMASYASSVTGATLTSAC
ncbi:hypothetical protein GDO78_003273 [Eleutherodactylus coqui]|uniref:Uncharacterized protein n=1 Tax=Eleutherodactylus coqui TaxID=57060 RepID=A0A8J6ERX0_ELECQ|nr:hypothetical protein GDO78_003273 [Eleutherodactylus coqui]